MFRLWSTIKYLHILLCSIRLTIQLPQIYPARAVKSRLPTDYQHNISKTIYLIITSLPWQRRQILRRPRRMSYWQRQRVEKTMRHQLPVPESGTNSPVERSRQQQLVNQLSRTTMITLTRLQRRNEVSLTTQRSNWPIQLANPRRKRGQPFFQEKQ